MGMTFRLVEIGKKYGRLTIIKDNGFIISTLNKKIKMVLCKCECGKIISVRLTKIKNGNLQSCGCLQRDSVTTHGKRHHPLYGKWRSIKLRCMNANNKAYKNYGERGITICDEWKDDFGAFYNWCIGSGYNDALEIDRINNEEGYYPQNCRWVTPREQGNNRRTNIKYFYIGELMTIPQICRLLNIENKRAQVWRRINKYGWSLEESLIFKQ